MPRTLITAEQIQSASITRGCLNTATTGSAVITKVIAGTGITITSTGTDPGTGDVTINTSISAGPTGPSGPTGPTGPYMVWQEITATSTLTGSVQGILADTSAGGFTITLPSSPTVGQYFLFRDNTGTWGTNNLIVNPGSNNIQGLSGNLTCNQNWAGFDLYYEGGSLGWEIQAASGYQGANGATGPSGPSGPSGPAGPTGASGPTTAVRYDTSQTYTTTQQSQLVTNLAQLNTISTITYASSIALNFNDGTGLVKRITLTGNATLAAPTNGILGTTYIILVTQDTTGSRTLSYASNFDFGNSGSPTLSTTASLTDILSLICYDQTNQKFYTSLVGKGF